LGALPKIFIDDPDASLFPALLDGVPTGIHKDIPASHVFSPLDPAKDDTHVDVSTHFSKWKSAEDHPA
jgi:hypothetical protein